MKYWQISKNWRISRDSLVAYTIAVLMLGAPFATFSYFALDKIDMLKAEKAALETQIEAFEGAVQLQSD